MHFTTVVDVTEGNGILHFLTWPRTAPSFISFHNSDSCPMGQMVQLHIQDLKYKIMAGIVIYLSYNCWSVSVQMLVMYGSFHQVIGYRFTGILHQSQIDECFFHFLLFNSTICRSLASFQNLEVGWHISPLPLPPCEYAQEIARVSSCRVSSTFANNEFQDSHKILWIIQCIQQDVYRFSTYSGMKKIIYTLVVSMKRMCETGLWK